jgi:hypothetical protein
MDEVEKQITDLHTQIATVRDSLPLDDERRVTLDRACVTLLYRMDLLRDTPLISIQTFNGRKTVTGPLASVHRKRVYDEIFRVMAPEAALYMANYRDVSSPYYIANVADLRDVRWVFIQGYVDTWRLELRPVIHAIRNETENFSKCIDEKLPAELKTKLKGIWRDPGVTAAVNAYASAVTSRLTYTQYQELIPNSTGEYRFTIGVYFFHVWDHCNLHANVYLF